MTQTETQAHKWRDGEGAFVRAHLAAVQMDEPDGSKSRIRALPWGEVELRDASIREMFDEPGALLVNARSVAEIPANFAKRDTDFFVNVSHDGYGPACGWIEDVDVVEGEGIYLSVSWTPEGERLVRDRVYRYSSIEVILDGSAWLVDGSPATVVAVVGLALTNVPAVVGQPPVAFHSLTAALAARDGRERVASPKPPDDVGEKGALTMGLKEAVARVFGREFEDDAEAVATVAELRQQTGDAESLRTQLAALRGQVDELTAQLAARETKIAELETEAKGGAVKAAVDSALSEGRISPAQEVWARSYANLNLDGFKGYLETVKAGTFAPPAGRQVTGKAIDSVDTTSLADGGIAEHAEIEAYAKEHNVRFHEAALAVKKQRSGKGE